MFFFEICNTQITPFHPQSDGASERNICTVNYMLVKIVREDQKNWDLYIPSGINQEDCFHSIHSPLNVVTLPNYSLTSVYNVNNGLFLRKVWVIHSIK